MPSPVGHTLIGLSLLALWRFRLAKVSYWFVGVVVLANFPDIDFLPGLWVGEFNRYHHMATHSLGFILLVTFLCWLSARFIRPFTKGELLLIISSLGSHLVADYLCADGKEPFGIMAAWPLSSTYYISSRTVFWPLQKANLTEVFQWYNVQAVGVEILLTLPLVIICYMIGKRFREPEHGIRMKI